MPDISEAIERLRSLSQVNIQSSWRFWESDFDNLADEIESILLGPVAQLNAKGHIAWSSGQRVLWLAQRLVVPQDLQGYPVEGLSLRLALTWWAEAAQIFVNGVAVQAGDLFDCSTRVLLSEAVTPGEEITVALRLVSPGHDDGALVRSLCLYESTDDNRLDPGFVADELSVLQRYLDFEPEKLPNLAAAVAEIDWSALPNKQFERSLVTLRHSLLPLAKSLQQRQVSLLGHAHLDLAWLWPVSETWQAAQRTFESVLKLQEDFPLIFCHSTPALYAWIEQHRPDLFAAIQRQVAAERWEVVGGLWVEPDLNLISGESIVRQLLYGQRYVLEKFGKVSPVAWLPDSFGFCATLPQIFASGGVEYFVTQKLRWNDTTKFPYSAFWWQSPDGTQIFSLMSAPIGEGIDPVKMATYACEWETQTSLQDALWLPGVGDHGGGPTRDMLEVAKRWQHSPFFPRLEFTTALRYLQQIAPPPRKRAGFVERRFVCGKDDLLNPPLQICSPPAPPASPTPHSPLPIWKDELYLEFHRGCYTTHADQKQWNRRCEKLLYQAELFAALATLSAGVAYPKVELATAWKKVLFNQFHDILPGSAIPQVYVDADRDWREVEQVGTEILQQSLRAIASQITFPQPPQPEAVPIVIFNSLNWQRSEVVAVSLPTPPLASGQVWQIYNEAGMQMRSQRGEGATLLFLATDIPSVGYRLFWLCPEEVVESETTDAQKDWVLENEVLRAIIDAKTGNFCSIFDKIHHREILKEEGNQLQTFQDSGQYWDAWNIDPNYAQHPLPPTQLKSLEWLEQGPIQSRLRVVRQLGKSDFCQDYILQSGSAVLKIITTVNWQERHVLVKAAFPLNLEADYATYEIPCGAIERSTQPQTPAEQAKWEVPALHWADLTLTDSEEGSYGISLLNDCKYGYDSQPNQLRLTLLRGSSWPDPDADKGYHEFTYALYPHSGTWQSAHTVRRGHELNQPLQVMLCSPGEADANQPLPAKGCLLDLQSENLVLMAFKQSEDNPHQWILRCYECHGETTELSLHSDLGLSLARTLDILERPVPQSEQFLGRQPFRISPWKMVTLEVTSVHQS